jgi:hypothetical protein
MTDFDSTNATPTLAPPCPKCGGDMWDNRESKRNPKAPDFKCKDKSCDGIIWPPRTASAGAAPVASSGSSSGLSYGVQPAQTAQSAQQQGAQGAAGASPNCPICGGPMWDDRASKRNPKAPDFKCKNKPKVRGGPGCEGVIWPPRDGQQSSFGSSASSTAAPARPRPSVSEPTYGSPPPYDGPPPDDDDLLPF